jgi:hypothetical protein
LTFDLPRFRAKRGGKPSLAQQQKEKLEMTTELTNYQAAAGRLLQLAQEMQSSELGRLLKFVKGAYTIGDDDVPIGTEMIAHVDQIARGWVKFRDNKVVDQRIGKPVDGFVMPPRNELDDRDEAQWERDASGAKRDPWTQQYYLPMENVETGDVAVFVTGSHGGCSAISKLLKVFARNAGAGLPIIRLTVASYKHRTYGRIETPDFPIVGRTGVPAQPTQTIEPAGASARELDDEIPF